MKKILFVCLGNIARSQMAEAFYNHYTKSNNAISAAVSQRTPQIHPHVLPLVVDIMNELGIDVSEKRSKYINQDMIDSSDEIYIMCEKENCPSFLLDSDKINFWNIQDPYKKDIETARKIRDEIRSKVLQISK